MAVDADILDSIHSHYGTTSNEVPLADMESFLGGRLRIVRFDDSTGKSHEVSQYTSAGGGKQFLQTAEDLANFVTSQKTKFVFWEYFISVVGISGVIAVLISIGILIDVYRGVDAPEFLKTALTVILGFYFGAAVKGASGIKS